MTEQKTMEMRGMRRQEIFDYFYNLKDLKCDPEASTFRGEHIYVEVSEEFYSTLGKIKIPSTIVKLSGDKEFLDQAIYRFRLRFLTAGG